MMRTRRPLLPLLVCLCCTGRENLLPLYSATESLARSEPAKSAIALPPVALPVLIFPVVGWAPADQSASLATSTPPRAELASRDVDAPPSAADPRDCGGLAKDGGWPGLAAAVA